MKLSQTHYDNAETGCCARVDEKLWDGRVFEWQGKPFLKDHIREFLHMPLNFGSVMGRAQAAVEKAEAYTDPPLWITDEVSPWGCDIYLALDREVPSVSMEKLSGTFLTKTFEGPYSHIGQWIKEMDAYVTSKGRKVQKTYFHYATCPKCAKHYGKNQVVLFAQVA